MQNKNFIVIGTPRSGTTFFCKVLNDYNDIWLPEFPNYEPFNPWSVERASNAFNTHLFDQDLILKKMLAEKERRQINYFGFKTFTQFHTDLLGLIDRNELDIILILRKDFWKVLASQLVAIDHNDYKGSSTKYEPFVFQDTFRERRRILGFFGQICKSYWWCENIFSKHKNFVDLLYLEDFSQEKNSFQNINNYFDREVILENNYENKNLEHYIKNYQEFENFIKEEARKSSNHYRALPTYITQGLDL